jgi:hypothetical protein
VPGGAERISCWHNNTRNTTAKPKHRPPVAWAVFHQFKTKQTQKILGHQACYVLRRKTNISNFDYFVWNLRQTSPPPKKGFISSRGARKTIIGNRHFDTAKKHRGNPSDYLSRVVNFKLKFACEMTCFALYHFYCLYSH